MRLIDKYLLREFVLPFFYSFDAFLLLFIVVDLFENLGKFIQYHAKPAQVLSYYLTILPEAVVLMIPIALLLATLFCLSSLGKHNELIALRAGGVSVQRLAVPLFAVGIIAVLGVFAINEIFVPTARVRGDMFMSDLSGRTTRGVLDNFFFANARANRDWYARRFNTQARQLEAVEIHQHYADNKTPLFELFAQEAVWTNGLWEFREADIYDHRLPGSPLIRVTATNLPTIAETPRQLALEGRKPDQLKTAELRRQITNVQDPRRLAEYRVTFHDRYAFPMTSLIVICLAFPLGVRTSRRGGAMLSVGTALLLVVAFFFLTQFSLALGRGEHLPAAVAAWLTNAIFAAIGLVMFVRAR